MTERTLKQIETKIRSRPKYHLSDEGTLMPQILFYWTLQLFTDKSIVLIYKLHVALFFVKLFDTLSSVILYALIMKFTIMSVRVIFWFLIHGI